MGLSKHLNLSEGLLKQRLPLAVSDLADLMWGSELLFLRYPSGNVKLITGYAKVELRGKRSMGTCKIIQGENVKIKKAQTFSD